MHNYDKAHMYNYDLQKYIIKFCNNESKLKLFQTNTSSDNA